MWFAYEMHWSEAQVYGTSWAALVRLSLTADDVIEQRRAQANQQQQQGNFRRMT